MKLLENPSFCSLASALSVETSDCRLETRLESYSCKMLTQDKRIWKGMSGSPNDCEILSPPINEDCFTVNFMLQNSPQSTFLDTKTESDEHSPQIFCDSISRRTLFYLTQTLNGCFPDYDFSDARGENFCRVPSVEAVMVIVDGKLSPILKSYGSQLRNSLWATIDKEICLRECNVYIYTSDYTSDDPFSSDGAIWSFNYFFYNKKLKRIVFLSCRALRLMTTIKAFTLVQSQ